MRGGQAIGPLNRFIEFGFALNKGLITLTDHIYARCRLVAGLFFLPKILLSPSHWREKERRNVKCPIRPTAFLSSAILLANKKITLLVISHH